MTRTTPPKTSARGSPDGAHAAATNDSAAFLSGMTKTFRGDVTAVSDLSLTVGRGAVLGLLGPNGSGKTTTLRMLLGLVRPTAGSAYIFGNRMTPGHAVLRRVGVLIEKPGFVPHLSGRRNLELFWRAGGQDLREADFGRALDVAALGGALDRKVGTYSRGMQQRLGLAQALLNRPKLLILDEPTAGLDPQETHRVREIVREARDGGSTVILSSHVLSEVEQVCSHVAVLDRGLLVASGAVSDLTGAGSSIYLEVDDRDRAAAILRGMEGVTEVSMERPGIAARLDGIEREAVVAALVREGIGVETVTARHRLEDVFLKLTSGGQR